MPKSLVGRVKNERFAFFWLLIGGSIGNILLALYAINAWPLFVPSAALSLLVAAPMVGKLKRPKIWLNADLLVTLISLVLPEVYYPVAGANPGIFLPGILIVLGCVLGIMDW
jgi:hypothetical protein